MDEKGAVAEVEQAALARRRNAVALKPLVGERKSAVLMPEESLRVLRGKHFGLIGFRSEAKQRIIATLDQAGAFAGEFAASAAQPSSGFLKQFDALLAHIATTQPDKIPPPGRAGSVSKPILFFGSREELFAHNAAFSKPDRDFLTEPWWPEDLLLRLSRLLSIGQSGGQGALPSTGSRPAASVLVADDDSTIATMVAAVLKSSGLECRVAHDGLQALEMAREAAPGALVLDLNMPEMSGLEVLASLRNDAATSGIPVLILTTFHDEADVVRGFSLGANDYVAKPFNPVELAARVRRLLSMSW